MEGGESAFVARGGEGGIGLDGGSGSFGVAERAGDIEIDGCATVLQSIDEGFDAGEGSDEEGAGGGPCGGEFGIRAVGEEPIEAIEAGLGWWSGCVFGVRFFLEEGVEGAIAAPLRVEIRAVFVELGERLFPGEAAGFDNRARTPGRAGPRGEVFPDCS